MPGCLSADVNCSEKLTVSYKKQTMSRDIYPSRVDYPSDIFRNTRVVDVSIIATKLFFHFVMRV